jgi:hypothetical protein
VSNILGVELSTTLDQMLSEGEYPHDFKKDEFGLDDVDPTIKTIRRSVRKLGLQMERLQEHHRVDMTVLQRMGIKRGYQMLTEEYPGWDDMEEDYRFHRDIALDSNDSISSRILEEPPEFRFVHTISKDDSWSVYHWIFAKTKLMTPILGVNHSAAVLICMVLGVSTTTDILDEDLKYLRYHIDMRRYQLSRGKLV